MVRYNPKARLDKDQVTVHKKPASGHEYYNRFDDAEHRNSIMGKVVGKISKTMENDSSWYRSEQSASARNARALQRAYERRKKK